MEASASSAAASEREQLSSSKRPRDLLLIFFSAVSLLTALTGILVAFTFGMAIVEGSDDLERQLMEEEPWDSRLLALSKHFLRLTGLLGGMLMVAVETESQRVLQWVAILDFWAARGAFQLYLAALASAVIHTDREDDFSRSLMFYRVAVSTLLLLLGTFYMLTGALCFGALKRARLRREEERSRVLRDLEDVERRRQELRGLLTQHE